MTLISRKQPARTLPFLMALSVVLVALSCWVYASREGMFSLGWTTSKLKHIRLDEGFGYNAPTHHPELTEEREPSSGMVLENGIPLSGETGAKHDDIRKMGRGRSSFWGGYVYFSSSDNSPPIANGRAYEIRYPRYITDPFAFALYGCTILLLAVTVWVATRTPETWRSIVRAPSFSAGPFLCSLVCATLLLLALSLAACLNREGLLSLGWRVDPLLKIRHDKGFAYVALTHNPELGEGEEPSLGVVLENGVPLSGPADAPHDEIRQLGKGRSSFWSDLVYFSSSDNSTLTSNGRSYAIRYPRIIRSSFAITIYALAIILLATFIGFSCKTPALRQAIRRAFLYSVGPYSYSLLALSVLLFGASCAIYANRGGLLSLGWKTDVLTHIHHEIGFAFKAPTHHPELGMDDRPPEGMVLENGIRLPGASNASHDEIRSLGNGRYSFWSNYVYFSASDNSGPDHNGRSYAIRYPRTVGTSAAFAIYVSMLLVLGATICSVAGSTQQMRILKRAVSESVRPPYYILLVLMALSSVVSYATLMNRWGLLSLGWKTDLLTNIHPEGGFAYSAFTYNCELGHDSEPYSMLVLENGISLPGPAAARHDYIRLLGNGRYSFWKETVFFSTSDNSPPSTNGRFYEIRYPRLVSRPLAFALYGCTLLLAGAFYWLGREGPELNVSVRRITSYLAGPPFPLFVTIVLIFLALSFASLLSHQGALPFASKTDLLRNIQHEEGFAYSAPTYHSELGAEFVPTSGMVLENGAPLPGGTDASLSDIRNLGMGRSLFSGADVYFSARDNSSPKTNGRSYEIRYPRTVNLSVVFALFTASITLILALIWVVRNDTSRLEQLRRLAPRILDPPFYFPTAIVLFIFLITRLPYFLYYPVVGLSWDSASYLTLVAALKNGEWPLFIMRTPGYPLALWPFTFIANHRMPVVFFQSLMSLASASFIVHAVSRLRRFLALPAALAMGGFLGGSQILIYDTSIASESLYTSTTIFALAFLLLGFARSRSRYFLFASSAMAITILVRPAGMYLLVIYVVVVGYLLWNRYRPNLLWPFLIPFPAILFLCCTYNYFTVANFVVSPFGEANLAGATVLYWEPDPRFPDFINKALAELPASYKKEGITQADFKVLRESWDPYSLVFLYNKAYNSLVWSAGWGSGSRFGTQGYLFYRPYIRQVSLTAIRKHPVLYAKYVWTNFACFYSRNINYHYEFYSAIKDRVRDEFITKAPYYQMVPGEKEGLTPSLPAAIHIVGAGSDWDVVLTPHFLTQAHVVWETKQWRYYLKSFWIWANAAVFLLSAVQLVRFRGRHLGAFLVFVLSLVALGAGSVVALVELALNRYSCPTQFVFYLSLAMAPLLWTFVKRAPKPRIGPTSASDLGCSSGIDRATDF